MNDASVPPNTYTAHLYRGAQLAAATPAVARTDIVFVADNLTDWETLARGVPESMQVVVLDSRGNGLQQMADWLATQPEGSVDAVHVLSHGSAGQLNLGAVTLTASNLGEHAAVLAQIGQALTPQGDVLLYGCDVAAGQGGVALVNEVATLTRADVAASTTLTGDASHGGDWVLEFHTGPVTASALNIGAYADLLATVNDSFGTAVDAPSDLMVDSQNNLYVVAMNDLKIFRYDASAGVITGGASPTAFLSVGSVVSAMIDTTGNLYVGTGSSINSVHKYAAAGGIPGTSHTVLGTGFNMVSDIVEIPGGDLLLSDSGDGKVYRVSPASTFTNLTASASASVPGAQQMYLDAAKNLYVVSADAGKVIKFPAVGGAVSLTNPVDFVTGLNFPAAISSDGAGNFYVGDDRGSNLGHLYRFGATGGSLSTDGTLVHAFTDTPISELMWAGDNTLYATVSNGTGGSVAKITLPAANAAPTLGGITASTSINDTAAATPFSTVTVGDADADNVTVSVTLDAAAKGVFTSASLTASGFTSAGSGVYNLSSTTAAVAQAAIRQLVFNPTDNRVAPASTEMTTFTISVNDGVNTAVTNNTTTVTSTSVNDAPTLTSVTTLTGAFEDTAYAITYAALAAAADEADVDTGSTLSFRVEAVSSGNLYTDSGLTTQVTPGTTQLSTGGTWYWKAATHANGTGGSALDAFTVKAWDGMAASANAVQVKVATTAVNDIPALTAGTLNAITVLEDSANSSAASLGLGAITYGPGGGSDESSQTLSYTVTAIPSFVTVYKTDGTTPVSANSTVAASELQGLTYKTTANGSGTGNLTWTVVDNGGTANSGVDTLTQNLSITVTGVNDAPTRTAGSLSAISVNEDSANATATTLGLNAVTYGPGGGSDETSQTLTYTVTAIPSFVTLFKADGTTAVNATDTVTGTELAGLQYKTVANANGTGNITWTVVDNGGTVNSGANTLTENLSVTVSAVNDAPALTAGTLTAVTATEDSANTTATTLGLATVTYGNGGGSDENGQTLTYTITSIPSFITLFKADGTTAVNATDTVTGAELAGLKYKTVADAYGTGNLTWTVADSGGTTDGGMDVLNQSLGLTITGVADTPSVTNANTTSGTQTSSGLVLSRNTADSTEVTHFKVTGITNGNLFKNNGTTAINNGDFITFAEGNAGLKFTPTGGGNGSFTAQASTSNANGGLGGSTVNATIAVGAAVASPTVAEDNNSGAIAITLGGSESHYKITSITGGTLYADAGFTTPITDGSFIAQGGGGGNATTTNVYFQPSAHRNTTTGGNGSFVVQASSSNADGGLTGSQLTSTVTLTPVADTPSVTDATAIANAQNTSGLVLSRNAADGAETTHFKITGITGGNLFKNDGTTAITNGTFITFAEGNAGLKFTPSGTTAGSFTAQASSSNADGGLGGSTVNATINVATPTLTSATYDAITHVLTVTGTNLPALAGAPNDISMAKLTLTGEGDTTYQLTSSDVEITSSTSFAITLNATDQAGVGTLLNKAGLTSTGGATYHIAAATGWAPGYATTPQDLTSNAVTVSAVPVPTLTSATYDASTGALVLTGTGFLKLSGATNDIVANKFTFTAEGGATYTLTDTANVEITSGTAATLTLSATDKAAVNQIVNKNGTSSTGGTTYNIAAAEDWAAGAEAIVVVADTIGNAVITSNVAVPQITSASYDTGTGVLTVTGTDFVKLDGAINDIVINKLKITGQGGAGTAYTLTSATNVEISSGTRFTVTLSGADKTAVNALLNKTGTSANDNTAYVIGGLEDWAAGADAAVAVADEVGNAINVTVYVPPANPGPSTPSTQTVTTTVDGTTVQTTTTTGTGGTTTTTQTVAPVTTTRPEDPHTPNAGLADIPLATDSTGAPTVQVSLPVGVGLSSESTSGANLTLREQLIGASTTRVTDTSQMAQIIANGIDQYVPSVTDQSQVTVRTVTLTVAPPAGGGTPTPPAQPIVITGATGTGESDSLNPQRGEALVIDARNLPPGTVLDLNMVEFAIIIGPTTATGGAGRNYVIGDGSRQFIVLGPEDDVIHGGAGDDTVGSKGGDDQLFGDEGNDWVVGGIGNDSLYGGDGNDILQGGASDAGTWHFKLNAQSQLNVSFAPTSTELADSTGFSVTGNWAAPAGTHGSGPITDSRFAWVYDDYAVAKDAALLVQALANRLPSLYEMGGLADGTFNSVQLATMAHDYFVRTGTPGGKAAFEAQSLPTQVAAVINQVWGANSSTTDLVNLGVDHLSGGGSWASVWLALARYSTNASKITDAQGNVSLIDQRLSDTGWSANSGDDSLNGGAGNDVLIGGGGNDTLDGGAGTDMAVWLGAIADYQVALTPSTAQGAAAGAHDALVRNKLTGEVDTVRNVELIKVGNTAYSVPPGHPQPADNVFVELASYVQPVASVQLAGVGFNSEWVG